MMKKLTTLIATALIFTSQIAISKTLGADGESVKEPVISQSFTVNENEFFNLYIGLPIELNYQKGLVYHSRIMNDENFQYMEFNEGKIIGFAPEVNNDRTIIFKIRTQTHLDAPNEYIYKTYQLKVRNK